MYDYVPAAVCQIPHHPHIWRRILWIGDNTSQGQHEAAWLSRVLIFPWIFQADSCRIKVAYFQQQTALFINPVISNSQSRFFFFGKKTIILLDRRGKDFQKSTRNVRDVAIINLFHLLKMYLWKIRQGSLYRFITFLYFTLQCSYCVPRTVNIEMVGRH